LDVNVPPTKTEVKFVSERQIFDAVYHAVLSALSGSESPRPSMNLEKPKPVDTVTPRQTVLAMHDAVRPAEKKPIVAPAAAPVKPAPVVPSGRTGSSPVAPEKKETPAWVPAAPVRPAAAPVRTEPPKPAVTAPVQEPARPAAPPANPVTEEKQEPIPAAAVVQPEPEEPMIVEPEVAPWRITGEVFNTYIIVEQGDKILFIDKHAAHERMWFDQLKSRDWRPMSQMLLAPVVFKPSPEEGAVLLENASLLEEFGFEVEDFGGGSLIVRQVPHDIDVEQTESALVELASRLLTTGGRADPSAARDALLHTMACKAAIKGGQKNGSAELEKVARAVMNGEVKYCPHGRPVAIELTKAQLEKQFKRA